MPSIDIVIPHYGTGHLTEVANRCLDSIANHSWSHDYRVILVDNGSPEFDLLLPAIDRLRAAQIIRNTENRGFIVGTNLGICASTAPYVVLMNNDAEAAEQWLDKLLVGINYRPHVGLCGPLTTTPASWQGRWQTVGSGPIVLGRRRMLAFFCTMIRREVFEKIGLLDESFGVGFGDDDEYCRRAERAGFRLVLQQDLIIQHGHRSTFKTLYSTAQIAEMQEESMRTFRKDQPPCADRLPR